MPNMLRWAVISFIIGVGLPIFGSADEVILNSGETFSSQQVWEENDTIRFNMHGLIVSVNKADVQTIIRGQGNPTPIGAQNPLAAPTQSEKKTPVGLKAPQNRTQTNEPPLENSTPPSPKPSPPPVQKTRSIQGTGLHGLIWKAATDSIPGLVKIKTEPSYGGIDQYHRPEDTLQMGTARLDGMVYGFWQNQLYTIMAWVAGQPRYQQLKNIVRSHYGSGQPSASGLERYVWKDDDTDRMLEFDENLNTGIFWMRSRNLHKKIKRLYPE